MCYDESRYCTAPADIFFRLLFQQIKNKTCRSICYFFFLKNSLCKYGFSPIYLYKKCYKILIREIGIISDIGKYIQYIYMWGEKIGTQKKFVKFFILFIANFFILWLASCLFRLKKLLNDVINFLQNFRQIFLC